MSKISINQLVIKSYLLYSMEKSILQSKGSLIVHYFRDHMTP